MPPTLTSVTHDCCARNRARWGCWGLIAYGPNCCSSGLQSCRRSRNSYIQTDADIGSVCMDPLQRNGSGWFRRTDTAEEVFPGASAENGASHHLGMSGAPSDGGSAAHAALSLAVCNSVVTVLITPEVCELPPNRRQGDPSASEQIPRAKTAVPSAISSQLHH